MVVPNAVMVEFETAFAIPKSVTFATPSSVIIIFTKSFFKARSKYFTYSFSWSISSSSSLLFPGVESISSTGSPFSSWSSVISAVLIICLSSLFVVSFDNTASDTWKTICTSL